jgi:hypothetical protein
VTAERAGGDHPLSGALRREERTIAAMIRIYCRDHHGPARGRLCPECAALLAYAGERLRGCRYGAGKPTCANCPVHCYGPAMRERIGEVMRYAGPRMMTRHPVLAAAHLAKGRRGGPPPPPPTTGPDRLALRSFMNSPG